MGKSIHFRGIGAVMNAYDLNSVGPWAIWCQGKILFSSKFVGTDDVEEGGEQLQQVLVAMKRHGTQGVFELWVYRLSSHEEEIHSKLPHYRAFGFCLFENSYEGLSNDENRLMALLTKMEDRLKKLEEDDQGVIEEDETVMGKIGSAAIGLINRPEVQQAIAVGAASIMKKIFPKMNQDQSESRKVAGVSQNLLSAEQIAKVHDAINRLSVLDPGLGDHLQGLANIAERDPSKYQIALKFL